MHILGKVLLWFSVILIMVAAWLTSLTLGHRHRWMTSVETRQVKVEKQIQEIAAAKRRIHDLEESRQRLVHSWGDVWNAPNSGPQAGGAGAVELGVGSSSNLPKRAADGPPPAVYVFAQNGDKAQYLGGFSVAQADPARSYVQPSRKVLPQEIATWPTGTYHIRSTLPANWLTFAAQIEGQQAIADAQLVEQRNQLSVLGQMIKASQSILDQRMTELNGNPQAAGDASDDVKDGLVVTVRNAETARDTLLSQVDQLRRQMIETYDSVIKTLNANEAAAKKLDDRYLQPSEDKATTTTSKTPRPALLPPQLRTANRD